MSAHLKIAFGQYSDKGSKDVNQDFHGIYTPKEPQLSSKGIAIALADGISSSEVSQFASQAAVTAILDDYYCTSEAWSVKTSIEKVLVATNSWLHSQTRQSKYRYDRDRGYVCTLSAMVIKSSTAHIFHVGDTRIYQVHENVLEQLTNDHRIWASSEQSYLGRALGMTPYLELDYRTLLVETGNVFLFATDGVYEYADADFIIATIRRHQDDLDKAAEVIVSAAYQRGSKDNLTLQIVRVEELPSPEAGEVHQQLSELRFPPILEARMLFDGYRIIRELHASSRSHVYLAVDSETNTQVVIKAPSVDQRDDPAYLERFLMEEWIARRINSAYVLKPCLQTRKRNYIYVVMEFIEGQTLTQWMIDHPKPDLETARGIVEQIAKGLRAFQKLEMLHQDIRPENIMIDATGTVKIIDFGSAQVAGIMEMAMPERRNNLLGTAQYTAPEYFVGESGSSRSDLFSLGVITYQMLTGKLPYGAQVAKIKSKAAQKKLTYQSILDVRKIPAWIDEAIRKAVHPDPDKRYDELPEFIFDLHHPNKAFLKTKRPPLIERSPVVFWRGVSFILFILLVISLSLKATIR